MALVSVQEAATRMSENAVQASATNALLLPNVQNVFRDFNGNEEPEKAHAWIRELDITKNVNGW